MGDAPAAIEFDHVSMAFGRKTPMKDMRKTVLDDLSFTVERGSIVCLLGPSGARARNASNATKHPRANSKAALSWLITGACPP